MIVNDDKTGLKEEEFMVHAKTLRHSSVWNEADMEEPQSGQLVTRSSIELTIYHVRD
jgi:hypothetical protein